jgi:L-rhamnose mutarotase
MPRHCLTLDLKDDTTAIAEYKRYHVKIWPEVKQSLLDAGVEHMEIYLRGTRIFMIMDVSDSFSMARKAGVGDDHARAATEVAGDAVGSVLVDGDGEGFQPGRTVGDIRTTETK